MAADLQAPKRVGLVVVVALGVDQAVDLAPERADQEAPQALRRVVVKVMQEVALVQAPKVAHPSHQVAA